MCISRTGFKTIDVDSRKLTCEPVSPSSKSATRAALRQHQQAMAPPHTPSPGNAFGSGESSMRMPHLEFIYRVVAFMSPNNVVIPDIHSTGVARVILPISGGTVKGPLVNGVIVKDSGADWAQRIRGPRSSKVCILSCSASVMPKQVSFFWRKPSLRDSQC